jgi:virginiamycin B lyase
MTAKWILALGAACLLGDVLPAWSQNLPDGPGKELVASTCGNCHELRRVTNAGYSKEGWDNDMQMMQSVGVPLSAEQFAVVSDYLAKSFPEKPKPAAVLIPGDAKVVIKEWKVPTPGSRPHDPLAAHDGSIWYTGQTANKIGRLDPKTGEFKEYPITVPLSAPHGLTEDSDGNIWFAAIRAGYLGKLEPKTGKITEYYTNNPKAKDPHTPLFDKNGMLWFTMQSSNMIGRLNPKTGEMKIAAALTEKSNPYGIVFDSKGTPWFVEFNTNRVASIDPQTMTITEYTLPDARSRPRRVAITSDDVLWYGDYALGRLGKFDTKTKEVKEYPSPSGPRSLPYGITALNDIIWYSESNAKPNTLVRFDPKTEKFQTWVIPSGGGVIRNMMPDRDGNLVIACSGVNNVGLVEIKKSGM